MRLLFLTPQLPYPPRQGATLRNFHLLSGLARDHQVDLLTFLAPGEHLLPDNRLHKLCRRVATVAQPARSLARRGWETLTSSLPDMARRLDAPAMHTLLRTWLADTPYDGIQFEGIEMAPYLATAQAATAGQPGGPRLVFDNHNCEYLLQKRNALNDLIVPRRLLAGIYSAIQWWKLRRYERWACHTADITLAVSQPDAAALTRLMGQKLVNRVPIQVIPNGISLVDAVGTDAAGTDAAGGTADPYPTPNAGDRVRLVFTGKMDYRPNIDAVLWFAQSVLPLIVEQEPRILFQIVGMNPHPRILPLADSPYIEITGAVEDVKPYIHDASVFVIPLRVGGGTRFKVLEALAAGKPTVSTSLGVEGIGVTGGEQLLIADAPLDFAQAVLHLVDDQFLRQGTKSRRLGRNAQTFVAAHFSWDSIVPNLAALYENQDTTGAPT